MAPPCGVPSSVGKSCFVSTYPHFNHFCKTCNRLRITSDGHLRTCLFSDKMYPLRGLLRNPEVTDGDIAAEIRRAITEKPIGNELLKARRGRAVASGQMDSIGG